LAIGDLVEIANMKGMTAAALAASETGAPVPGSTSGSSCSSGSAGSAGGSVSAALIATVVSNIGEPDVDADMAELGVAGGGDS
jgi:subtilase family serine protease